MGKNRKIYKWKKKKRKNVKKNDPEINRGARNLSRIPWLKKT